jgi:hypothetical protein
VNSFDLTGIDSIFISLICNFLGIDLDDFLDFDDFADFLLDLLLDLFA